MSNDALTASSSRCVRVFVPLSYSVEACVQLTPSNAPPSCSLANVDLASTLNKHAASCSVTRQHENNVRKNHRGRYHRFTYGQPGGRRITLRRYCKSHPRLPSLYVALRVRETPNFWSLTQPTFRFGVLDEKGPRRTMEDAHSYVFDYDGVHGQGFFAVFDGHAGREAADWCGKNFYEVSSESIAPYSF